MSRGYLCVMSQTQDLLTEAVELLRAIAGYTANLEDVLRENTEAVNKWGASLEDPTQSH